MNSLQLAKILKSLPMTKNYFEGVFAGDRVINKKFKKSKQSFIIVNTAPSGHHGLHWVLLFKPKNGKKMTFYDSMGNAPIYYGTLMGDAVKHFSNFTKYPEKYYFLNVGVQPESSNTCGFYCIFFAFYLCLGLSINNIVKLFNKKDKAKNDDLILKWSKLMEI